MDSFALLLRRFLFLLCIMPSVAFSFDGHPYIGGSLGASIGKMERTYPQISYFSGTMILDSYPINNNHLSTVIGGINGGYEFLESQWRPAIALGLGAYQSGQYSITGTVVETATPDPSSTLYNYKYDLDSRRIMAEIQLTWLLGTFSPFINLGVGPSWNRTSSYTESSVNSTGVTPLSPFQSRTSANIAYQAGLGVSCVFNIMKSQTGFKHERFSLGYQYVDLGQASLGTRGSAYPYQLNSGRLTTYEVFLSYTHLF